MSDLAWLILRSITQHLETARNNGMSSQEERTTLEEVITQLAKWRDALPKTKGAGA